MVFPWLIQLFSVPLQPTSYYNMCQLHIFNPSHDEALAANSPYYYPAKAARTLATDLAVLPAWWAEEGDWILLPNETPLPPDDLSGRGVRFIHLNELKKLKDKQVEGIQPWGWDPLLVHQLTKAGADLALLPDVRQLEVVRELSSRRSAVKVLQAVHQDLPDTVGTSYWCTDEKAVWNLLEERESMMLKAPWSSSGRGVFAVGANPPESVRQRILRILQEQGAIEAEPLYRRISDFALEFYAEGGQVEYRGLSVFATTDTGAYAGNIVGEERSLLQRLPVELREKLPEVVDALCRHLHTLLADHYEGPLGVDLMEVEKTDGKRGLHPCVEINLRRTMGHVALALGREMEKGHTGIYRLQPVGTPHEPQTRLLTPGAQKMEAVLISE